MINRGPREINSLEWLDIIESEKKEGEKFAHYDVVAIRGHRLEDGRMFVVNDDPPTTNRRRSIEELRDLHLTDEQWLARMSAPEEGE